jgi:hypothetical protein
MSNRNYPTTKRKRQRSDESLQMYCKPKLRVGLGDWLKAFLSDGKLLFSLDVTYNVTKDGERTAGSINQNLKRLHRRILRYLAGSRNYHRSWFRDIEPKFLCFVDAPGSKRKKQKTKLSPTSRDSTLHHHIIIIADNQHKEKFNALTLAQKPHRLLSSGRKGLAGIREFRCAVIESDEDSYRRHCSYVSEWWLSHEVAKTGDETFFILPEQSHSRLKRAQLHLSREKNQTSGAKLLATQPPFNVSESTL